MLTGSLAEDKIFVEGDKAWVLIGFDENRNINSGNVKGIESNYSSFNSRKLFNNYNYFIGDGFYKKSLCCYYKCNFLLLCHLYFSNYIWKLFQYSWHSYGLVRIIALFRFFKTYRKVLGFLINYL